MEITPHGCVFVLFFLEPVGVRLRGDNSAKHDTLMDFLSQKKKPLIKVFEVTRCHSDLILGDAGLLSAPTHDS